MKQKWLYMMHIYSFVPFPVSEVFASEYLPSLLGYLRYFRGFFVLRFCICSHYSAFKSAGLYLDEGKKDKPTFSIVAQVICSDIKSQMRV